MNCNLWCICGVTCKTLQRGAIVMKRKSSICPQNLLSQETSMRAEGIAERQLKRHSAIWKRVKRVSYRWYEKRWHICHPSRSAQRGWAQQGRASLHKGRFPSSAVKAGSCTYYCALTFSRKSDITHLSHCDVTGCDSHLSRDTFLTWNMGLWPSRENNSMKSVL